MKPVIGLETAPIWEGVEVTVGDEDAPHFHTTAARASDLCPQYLTRCLNGTPGMSGARTNNNDMPHRETQTAFERQNQCCRYELNNKLCHFWLTLEQHAPR